MVKHTETHYGAAWWKDIRYYISRAYMIELGNKIKHVEVGRVTDREKGWERKGKIERNTKSY